MTGRWRRWAIAGVEAGAGVGLVDAGFAMGWHGEWLASRTDRLVFALSLAGSMALAVGLLTTIVALAAETASALTPARRAALGQGVAIALGFVAGFGLFSGTAMRHSPARPYAILATVALCAWIGQVLIARWKPLSDSIAKRPGWSAAACLLASAGLYVAHALLFVRLYPVLHVLATVASLAALVTSLALGIGAVGRGRLAVLAVVIIAGGSAGVAALMRTQTRRALARERAPVSTYAVRSLGAVWPAQRAIAVLHDDRASHGASLDLRGVDVVLITVDALRPDRLGAYGGPRGLTPALDALAREAVVVEHAYCTTPHTSYSLASLMTGKFFREVSSMGPPGVPHETLAGLLGHAGYRTAAFYPPAIWQVDAERLGDLRGRGFDFTDRYEGWDDAATRVGRAIDWLRGVPANRRVFVWVHLFEPHESYEAHPGARASGEAGALGRYDGEVAVADDAIATLRQAFVASGRRVAWVVTADHGEEFGEHGGQFHGTTVYEEQVRVPLFVSAPGLAPRRIEGPVSLVDLLPTIIAGVDLPRPARLRGRELGPELRGGATDAAVYASAGSMRLVASGADRLVCDVAEGSCALFDLARDPEERVNRADLDAARVTTLRGWMTGWEGSHARYEGELDVYAPPEAVVRVLQGDRSAAAAAASALPALSGDVKRRTVRALADLAVRDAAVLEALAVAMRGADVSTAREAGVALASLGDARGEAIARDALAAGDASLARRAALSLARMGSGEGIAVLSAWALDQDAPDAAREAVFDALERLHAPGGFDACVALLDSPRWVARAAMVLGVTGDTRATGPLERTLDTTRYPAARVAAARALQSLRDPALPAILGRVLARMGADPEVFALAHALDQPGDLLAGIAETAVTAPGTTVRFVPSNRDTVAGSLAARIAAPGGAIVRLAGETVTVAPGVRVISIAGVRSRSDLRVEWSGSPGTIEVLRVPAQ